MYSESYHWIQVKIVYDIQSKMVLAGGQVEIQTIIHIGMEMQATVLLVVHVLRLNHVKGLYAASMSVTKVSMTLLMMATSFS